MIRMLTSARRGTTLLEVMVALGILATAYVALLEVQSGAINLSTYGKQLTVATFLAQTKMEEVEEKLTKEGFPDMDDTEDGDFDDQGYPHFHFKLEVLKVELPLDAAFDHLLASFGQGGEGQEDKTGSPLDKLKGSAEFGQFKDMFEQQGLLGKGASAGGGMGGLASMLNPEMLRGQVDALATMLEESIRLEKLTVSWGEGGPGHELTLSTHLVRVPQAASAAGSQPGMTPGTQPGMATASGMKSGLPGVTSLPPGAKTSINKSVPGLSGNRSTGFK
jgi:general secretion pathway protein I